MYLDQVPAVVGHLFLRVRDLPEQQPLQVNPEVLDERRRPARRTKVEPLVHRDRLVVTNAVTDGMDARV